VTTLGGIYLAIGIAAIATHWRDGLLAEVISLLAVVAGIFMLLGRNWARWLALAWMAAHVVISAFNKWPEFVIHCVFLIAIAWLLFFRPTVKSYFSP
jgi:hypothetical protein